jgi:hypothetical protein
MGKGPKGQGNGIRLWLSKEKRRPERDEREEIRWPQRLLIQPERQSLNIRFRFEHSFRVFERLIKCERCKNEFAVEANGRLGEGYGPWKSNQASLRNRR